jgi:NADPH:quinone reductase-like Zn-dependent oxidoreductase
MKAFIVDKYGKDSRLRAGQLPDPEIGDHDVLVRILAAGVNPLDAKIMAGEFKLVLPYKPPFVLGNDLAGVVERVGPGVQRFTPGEQVYARPDKDRIGTFAELIAIDEADARVRSCAACGLDVAVGLLLRSLSADHQWVGGVSVQVSAALRGVVLRLEFADAGSRSVQLI